MYRYWVRNSPSKITPVSIRPKDPGSGAAAVASMVRPSLLTGGRFDVMLTRKVSSEFKPCDVLLAAGSTSALRLWVSVKMPCVISHGIVARRLRGRTPHGVVDGYSGRAARQIDPCLGEHVAAAHEGTQHAIRVPPVLFSVSAGMQTLPQTRGSEMLVNAFAFGAAATVPRSVRIPTRICRLILWKDITFSFRKLEQFCAGILAKHI
jgi:hypothetical protein